MGVAARAFLIAAMVGGLLPAAVPASAAPGDELAQAGGTFNFNIAAKPLPQALTEFGAVTGLRVLYTGDQPYGVSAQPVSGSLSAEDALTRLLVGTGFVHRFTNATTVTLEKQTAGVLTIAPASVERTREVPWGPVDGYVATRSASGTKTNAPIIEVPQSISVVTADQMRDQGVTTVSQALRYTPGVMTETYGAASQFDYFTQVRGFLSDFYIDGMRTPYANTGWASTVLEPYGLERMEIVKGPSSTLYGQAGPGGLVNMTTKRPSDEAVREVEAQTGSFQRVQGAFDVGGKADDSGQFLFRLTGLARDANTQVDYIENNRAFIAPAFTWKPTTDTSFTILSSYQTEWGGKTGFNYVPTSGTLRDNPNGRIPFDRYLGEPGFDTLERDQISGGYLFEHRFDDWLAARQNLRFTRTEMYLRALNRSGELAADNRTLSFRAFGIDSQSDALTVDNQVELNFNTGAVGHQALVGVDLRAEDNSYHVGRGATTYTLDVFAPAYGQTIADPGARGFQDTDTDLQQYGAYLQDQIKWESWILTLGGRADYAESATTNGASFATSNRASITHQHDVATTGRIGLSYQFDSGVAPYASYGTSFQPAPGAAFGGAAFKPITGEQYELGIKYQPPGSNSMITAAAFDLTQQNRLTTDPVNTGFQVQYGEVNVKGIELEAKVEVTEELNVISSYTMLDHNVTASASPSEIGRHVAQTPRHQASLWGDYTFQHGDFAGLGFGGGVRYVGSTYDVANTTQVPGYDLYDARISYDLGKLSPEMAGAKLQLNANNLFDTYYVTQCTTNNGCNLGFRRTILATLTYDW
jgi:iron complex outermembrane receptor protein